MASYEESGAWLINEDIDYYTSPGSHTALLTAETYKGKTIYRQYAPVVARLSMSAGTLTETVIPDVGVLRAYENSSALPVMTPFVSAEGVRRYPVRLAGYEVEEGSGVALFAITWRVVSGTRVQTLAVSGTGSITGGPSSTKYSDPGELALFRGRLLAIDDDKIVVT